MCTVTAGRADRFWIGQTRVVGRFHDGDRRVFFYFNKLGCLGSILVSVVLTGVMILALRSCNG